MIRLAVRVTGDDHGIVLAELMELSPGGVEERSLGGGAKEYVVYGAPGELPALPALEAAVGEALVDVSTTELPDDWSERWKQWHRPIEIAGRLRVRPPWEPREGDHLDVVIDPGQAFGTGSHATTKLCLELLCTLEPGGPLADWGAGTAVLAIAAAKLGWGPIAAVDHDPAALEAAAENAAANGVALEIGRVDLRREPGPHAPTVCANLVRPLLLAVAANLTELPERLIISGLLRHETDEVAAAFTGLQERERREEGEWAAVLLTR